MRCVCNVEKLEGLLSQLSERNLMRHAVIRENAIDFCVRFMRFTEDGGVILYFHEHTNRYGLKWCDVLSALQQELSKNIPRST